jgi:hypothetical protein
VHYKFIAFTANKTSKIPALANLLRAIRHRVHRENAPKQAYQKELEYHFPALRSKMAAFKSTVDDPVIPLVPEPLPSIKDDKTKWIQLDLKVKAGSTAQNAAIYKKNIRVFDDGTPYEWIHFRREIEEVFRQNSVDRASDRVAIISAILKNESLTAFEVALEDARQADDNGQAAQLAIEHVDTALVAVATTIFPFRALEIQRSWMNRGMKKPHDLSTRKTVAAIRRLNNCLPIFPEGNDESKFKENELIGLLEWSLPRRWRSKFDLDNFVPSKNTLDELIRRCEAMERSEVTINKGKDKNDNKKNGDKKKSGKFEKSGSGGTNKKSSKIFRRDGSGRSRFQSNSSSFKNRDSSAGASDDKKSDEKPKPFSKRSFRKEINAMARKAGKKGTLDMYEAALKREKAKQARSEKKRKAKKDSADDSSDSSDSDDSVNILEKPIPRKKSKIDKKDGKTVSFAEKLQQQRERAKKDIAKEMEKDDAFLNKLDKEEKAFLKKVKAIEKAKETESEDSDSSDNSVAMIEKVSD